MAVVIITGGELNGEQVEIAGSRLTIGRSTDCDVILRSKDVSSRHAQLVMREKVWWLQDMGSTNGTLIQKKRVVQQILNPGDEFSIGL
jgi:pSer/pThr/pTyr-binding forkhead associated (FHA) protein